MKQNILDAFQQHYGVAADAVFFAPARVNLIGEHIDYNGGLVMPCALETGTYLAIRRTEEPVLKFSSMNFPGEDFQIAYEEKKYEKDGKKWSNYPLGVVDYFLQDGKKLSGLEFLFFGNIPNGGGLSSSASIEVVTAFALNLLFNCGYSNVEIALLSQKVENQFIGVNCGIMDQFSIAMGKKDHAIVLNCQTLDYKYIPFKLEGKSLVIINTNKQRTLADSKYNERRASCEAALEILNQNADFKDLCSISPEYFEANKEVLDAEKQQRVKHVVNEQNRVIKGAEILQNNDIPAFGKFMNASHQSLMEDYEVTGLELDTVYLESKDFEGVDGVRMTGAGFGGCAIAIVNDDRIEDYKAHLIKNYTEKVGYEPSIFIGKAGDGVRQL